MAITEKSQVDFCNESVRTLADKMVQVYKEKKIVLARFSAINKVYPFPNDSTGIDDGSDVDRRLPIVSSQVVGLIQDIAADVAAYEADDYAVLNSLMSIAVNY